MLALKLNCRKIDLYDKGNGRRIAKGVSDP